jgi:uncharacterized SAM-binding protein YcdF (DUF218 family)
MFFITSKIFEFLFTPSHLGLFVTSVGVALCFSHFKRLGRGLALVGVVALLTMAFSPLGQFIALPLENRFPPPSTDMASPDGIIVLGGSVDENLTARRNQGVRLNRSAERLTAGVELSRRFPKARLVFTGGSAALLGSTNTEAQVVKRFWRELGVDTESAIFEDRSRNTYENVVFVRDLVKPKAGERWLLVTSAVHMPRAIGIFRRAEFPVIPYPVDFHTTGSWTDLSFARHAPAALEIVDGAMHEWVGLIAYRLTGKTDALFPEP